jgi:NAD-dependent SIR2 family protein deacetylase
MTIMRRRRSMPVFTDVTCEDCNYFFEISKDKVLDDFKMPRCPKCDGRNVHRRWSNISLSVAEGSVGNAATGYASNFTYHPSVMGRMRGKRIK